jgi:hypothetical protein
MKLDAINKVLQLLAGKEQALSAVRGIPDGGKPSELPADPEAEAMGPPENTPPVETGEFPGFNFETGLPYVAMGRTPEDFPGDDDDHAQTEVFDDFV